MFWWDQNHSVSLTEVLEATKWYLASRTQPSVLTTPLVVAMSPIVTTQLALPAGRLPAAAAGVAAAATPISVDTTSPTSRPIFFFMIFPVSPFLEHRQREEYRSIDARAVRRWANRSRDGRSLVEEPVAGERRADAVERFGGGGAGP